MEICSKCGAEMVLNPKTNKMFCKEKCWLKNSSSVTPNNQGQPVNAPIVKIGNTRTQKDIDIIRESALKSACSIDGINAQAILAIAESFENWILR